MGDRQDDDDDDDDKLLSSFLQTFPAPLHHYNPEPDSNLWVFWSKPESQNNSSSDHVRLIYHKIKSIFIEMENNCEPTVLQFWVPVTISGRRVLSSVGQPFAVSGLDNCFAKYMLHSQEYLYNIDETNELDIEKNPKIINGAIATAFLSRFPERVCFKEEGSLLDRYAVECKLMTSYLIPIWSPLESNSHCIGVVEYIYSTTAPPYQHNNFREMKSVIERVGLRVFDVQEHIPYEIISGLKRVTDGFFGVLETVCESHNIYLAQVWMAYEDKSHCPFSSSLGDTQKKRMLSLKLTGYCVEEFIVPQMSLTLDEYYYGCDMFPLQTGEQLVEKTLQDYKPRFCQSYVPLYYDGTTSRSLVICLRSINTGDLDYVFEFIWSHYAYYYIFLESLLLTLRQCLPSFRFASGAMLGYELDVVDVDGYVNGYKSKCETQYFKLFYGSKVPEKGKKQMVEDNIAHSETKSKTTPIPFSRQAIEQQFGNTMKEAPNNLNVSLSTLKRKSHGYGISEWQGSSLAKRKLDDSSHNQGSKNNENTLILKAEYAGDMIKFYLSISEATFVTVEKEIGLQFNLTMGTYKLKYLDEDGDWILLKSDQDMSCCIRSSRKFDRTLVRLRVQQSAQPIPTRSTGSYEIRRS